MDDIEMPNIRDISQLQIEQQSREKFCDLQDNTNALQEMQKELLETRYALYNTELELEKERGVSRELKMRLKAVMDTMNELQQMQMKNQVDNVQLQVKYDSMAKHYDSLMSEATAVKVRETDYKIKMQNLEENLRQKDVSNKTLERTLKELECNSLRTITTIDHKIAELKQNHKYLQKSSEEIISLNQRLQIVGLCTHAIHQKDKAKIKNLECRLASMSLRNAGFAGKSVENDVHLEIKKLPPQFAHKD